MPEPLVGDDEMPRMLPDGTPAMTDCPQCCGETEETWYRADRCDHGPCAPVPVVYVRTDAVGVFPVARVSGLCYTIDRGTQFRDCGVETGPDCLPAGAVLAEPAHTSGVADCSSCGEPPCYLLGVPCNAAYSGPPVYAPASFLGGQPCAVLRRASGGCFRFALGAGVVAALPPGAVMIGEVIGTPPWATDCCDCEPLCTRRHALAVCFDPETGAETVLHDSWPCCNDAAGDCDRCAGWTDTIVQRGDWGIITTTYVASRSCGNTPAWISQRVVEVYAPGFGTNRDYTDPHWGQHTGGSTRCGDVLSAPYAVGLCGTVNQGDYSYSHAQTSSPTSATYSLVVVSPYEDRVITSYATRGPGCDECAGCGGGTAAMAVFASAPNASQFHGDDPRSVL